MTIYPSAGYKSLNFPYNLTFFVNQNDISFKFTLHVHIGYLKISCLLFHVCLCSVSLFKIRIPLSY